MQERVLSLLLAALQEMGAQRQNPLLVIMGGEPQPQQGSHYPQEGLYNYRHDGRPLYRAYYHSHVAPFRFAGEHGHFHLFVNIGDDEVAWSHLAALSMSAEGQPQRWFSVNRWVTDGPWLQQQRFASLALPELKDDMSAIDGWLWSLLSLYWRELAQLLRERDAILLREIMDGHWEQSKLESRDYYLLSEIPIDLLDKINTCIADNET